MDLTEAAPPTRPNLYRFKANGEDKEVTYEELIRLASMGVDYTRKTTELANLRKAIEAKEAQARLVRDKYAERLVAVEKLLTELAPAARDQALRQFLAALRNEQDAVRATLDREFHARLASVPGRL